LSWEATDIGFQKDFGVVSATTIAMEYCAPEAAGFLDNMKKI
jgi:hypothetical protein